MAENTYIELIQELENSDHRIREQARYKLIALGKDAFPALATAIDSGNPNLRWQASNILKQFRDPALIPDLMKVLEENPYFGVRWAIADGLCHMGKPSLVALLPILEKHPDSAWLRETATHILHCLRDQGVEPRAINLVLDALKSMVPEVEVPVATQQALELIKKDTVL